MAEEQRGQQQEMPRPSQAEGDRETIEQATGDTNNAQQTRREEARNDSGNDTTPRPSQAEGDR